jgi:hypothetical protein
VCIVGSLLPVQQVGNQRRRGVVDASWNNRPFSTTGPAGLDLLLLRPGGAMGTVQVRSLDQAGRDAFVPERRRRDSDDRRRHDRPGRFQPGWRWSDDVKPIAGTDWCIFLHEGYCVSGSAIV